MKKYTDDKNEVVKDSDAPFKHFCFDYSSGFSGFQFHWHEEIEIHYIVKGHGTFFIDDAEYKVSEGDIVYIGPKLIHSGKSEDNDLIAICYMIDNTYLLSKNNIYSTDRFFRELLDTKIIKPVIHMTDTGYQSLKTPLLEIDMCAAENGMIYQLEIKKQLYDLFIQLYKHNYLTATADKNYHNSINHIIKKAIRYIQANCGNRLSIDEIASHVGLSSSYFMKVFKENTKITCIEYIKSFRLNLAITMLRETDENILHIANNCGYGNLSLFNRDFKKYYNLTPSQYRKKYSSLN